MGSFLFCWFPAGVARCSTGQRTQDGSHQLLVWHVLGCHGYLPELGIQPREDKDTLLQSGQRTLPVAVARAFFLSSGSETALDAGTHLRH